MTQWRDLSPRFGFAYDIFGTGRTAIKGSVNRYVLGQSVGATARTANPASAAGDVNQRIWHDDNHDYIPQGDPLNPAANGEIGPSTNLNFGLPKFSSRFDPAYMHGGWGVRGYNWEMTSSIQHELASGVSATAAYFRRIYGNATVTDNLLLGPGDYDSFCITAPNDPRLPGNGGYPLCGLSNIKPASLAKGTDNFITLAKNYGDLIEHYDGVDLTVNARMRGGLLMAGGLNLGRTFTDNCSLIDKLPETVVSTPSSYCHASTPWQQQVKFYASYGLPWNMQLSGTFQDAFVFGGLVSSVNLGVQANYVATNAVVQPSLGRPLAGASNVTVNLITPGSDYQNRVRQLDLRVSRLFTAGGAKLRTMVDLYNVFNTNPMVEWNNSYGTNGATWLTPLTILSPRLIKFGVQLDF